MPAQDPDPHQQHHPILRDGAPERDELIAAGVEPAYDGLEVEL